MSTIKVIYPIFVARSHHKTHMQAKSSLMKSQKNKNPWIKATGIKRKVKRKRERKKIQNERKKNEAEAHLMKKSLRQLLKTQGKNERKKAEM